MNLTDKKPLLAAAVLVFGLLSGCTLPGRVQPSPSDSVSPSPAVESPSPSPSPSPTPASTKDTIQAALDAKGDKVYSLTWSPDETAAVYIAEESGAASVYLWKVGSEQAQLLTAADDTTNGFLWAPDSLHFIIMVGHMGPGTITGTLVDAEGPNILTTNLTTVSVSPFLWSPDGRFIVSSAYNEADSSAEILIYAVASGTSVSIQKETNTFGPYVIEKWENADITYTAPTSETTRSENILGVAE